MTESLPLGRSRFGQRAFDGDHLLAGEWGQDAGADVALQLCAVLRAGNDDRHADVAEDKLNRQLRQRESAFGRDGFEPLDDLQFALEVGASVAFEPAVTNVVGVERRVRGIFAGEFTGGQRCRAR